MSKLRSLWFVLGVMLLGTAITSYFHSEHISKGRFGELRNMDRETKLDSGKEILSHRQDTHSDKDNEREKQRKQTIAHGCKAMRMRPTYHLYNHLTPQQLSTLDHFIVLEDLKLFYCCIPHAGCNTWKSILESHGGSNHNDSGVKNEQEKDARTPRLLSDYSTEAVRSILKEYSSFIFTRNPYYRLLSAFRTIFEERDPSFSKRDGSFEEIRRLYTSKIERGKQDEASNYSVSFPDFTDYVSNYRNKLLGKGEDRWREMYRLCHLCGVDYDFVGKYETFLEDTNQIISRYGLDKNPKNVELDDSDSDIDANVMKHYLSQLSPIKNKQFSKRYVADKFLFGYMTPE